LQADRFREVQAKLATMSLMEQYKYLTELMIEEREQRRFRQYRRHFTILTLDMIKADSYGIPKLTISPVGTLAYPHKVRVHFKTENYLVDLGGFRLVQTRGW